MRQIQFLFADGTRLSSEQIKGLTVEAVRVEAHGDWKTNLARGTRRIEKGERAVIVGAFENFEGRWVRIKKAGGEGEAPLDVPAVALRIITPQQLQSEEEAARNGYRFQACQYQAGKGDAWRDGIARVPSFGVSDVSWIIDAENGNRMPTVWDYHLAEGPCKHIVTREV